MSESRSGKKVANSLVALSSAAVLAVYSAGYHLTKAAAERFERQASQPRPGVPVPPTALGSARATEVAAEHPSPAPEAGEPSPAGTAPVAARLPVAASSAASESPAAPVASGRDSGIGARAEEPTPAAAPPAAAPAPVADEPAQAVTESPAVDPAPLPPSPKGQFVDGTYLGWGSCRHGDIQASVVVENGRIASTTIAQCLTRYSCNWIEPLVPQVAARQRADVDYVSGATESSYAFADAVADALSKAR